MSRSRPSLRRLLALGLAGFALAACAERVVTPSSGREVYGRVTFPEHRAAALLEFSPATAIDSVLIGPAPGSEDAAYQSAFVGGRVLLYARTALAAQMRFRVFLNDPAARSLVQARAVETATPSGEVDAGGSTVIEILP